MASSGVRIADLVTAMSLATDLGLGQPPEHMLRAARIGMRIGRRLGLAEPALCTLYDVSILTYLGCSVFGDEGARIFGDDIDFRAHASEVDLAGLPALGYMLRRAGRGTTAANRLRQGAGIVVTGGRAVVDQMANHCSAAGLLAERLGLSPEVRSGVEQSYARWDGRGVPHGLAGEEVSLAARVAHLAEVSEVLARTGGIPAALDVIRSRSGTHFDPDLVALVQRAPEELFAGLDDDVLADVIDLEPVKRPPLTQDQLDGALEAIGDFCDLRCRWFAGHAAGTARLTYGAAAVLGMAAEDATLLRRAALVHDVGRFGVPGQVWAKQAPLNDRERERMRLHVYFVERIFARPEPLRRIGALAALHHERADGSGYHRGLVASALPRSACVLAAADAYHAMLQPRPYRAAFTPEDAAQELGRDVGRGRLDGEAVEAVLMAAGQVRRAQRPPRPAGLTGREVEIVALLAQGLPNKVIAARLGISAKTVGNHVEHCYTKLGVTNRAGLAMEAMRLGLVQPG